MSALLAVVEEAGADGSIGGFVIACAVFAVFFMWVGYVVRGQVDRERRAAGPRVYGGPRPLPDARRRR